MKEIFERLSRAANYGIAIVAIGYMMAGDNQRATTFFLFCCVGWLEEISRKL